MIIIPAIDIINGNAVRLYKGDYAKEELISTDVISLAKEFENKGAKYLHLVDLDGAKVGKMVNYDLISKIVKSINIPVELGGGIRNMSMIDDLIKLGISRVILGTAAIKDKELLKSAVIKYKEKIAVGVDCKDGFVCTHGWIEKSDITYINFCKELENIGVRNIILTDISKDGTLEGCNIEMLKELSKNINVDITASGGIKDIQEIVKLNELDIYGAITGKAIYSGNLDLEEAIKITN
ncbi:1-(5-phosphoribosyl)-5-[(5-phosphoribosylamino)methylideneamino]imidazole-4-carboxamide isomerase [uncultured Clostridium sp.]|jgi:phosphoribosylformimino-5-aminoimidazole carboxamide ribotide isomerase|uniref:1-(5-phosphoribosyl)-5-[(5- phosphoribosylamino)methylideneamino]imidazole-4- carboxamide isomerase n=1 Tax=uncultured Clostridium sp. TaxID=59620 RepID=UPI00261C9DF0|nr:1-(5-phosphoribosyl)-5-[(5-phosphoribosylamino)methylideneamino]imidazole-4-carboxamide isomerase [uncultured Clostridium sp.]